MTTLLSALAGPFIIICLILIFGPCLINKGLAFVKNRINAVQLMILQRLYQPMDIEDSDSQSEEATF